MRRQINVLLVGSFCAIVAFACGQKQTEEELLKNAETFEKAGKFEESIESLEAVVENYPESQNADKALHRTAFIYYNNIHDFQKSIELQRKLIQTYPNSAYVPQARFMIGFIYANDLKEYAKAKEAYTEFLEKHPDDELVESVKWELQHLGEDVNDQLKTMFSDKEPKDQTLVR